MRYLLLIVLVFAVIWLVRRAGEKPARRRGTQAPQGAPGERMIECAHCGVHAPESECVRGDGQVFCSAEHRRLHRGGSA